MKILGLDVGDKRIGVAVSDALGLTAQGLETVAVQGHESPYAKVVQIAHDHDVEKIVVGLPKNMDGTIGPRAEKSQQFGSALEKRAAIPVQFWDERLTTKAAERTLISADVSRKKRKKVVDKLAAVLILQGYLDHACATRMR
ncbi:Holliday junction resolvase RuvX [Salicibibacter halophilus]|uniref:Putative pre-16S rRNA nuclease n=1 Tax=Salicibibacter halophilus TaxID=2502791 RepID=A0A514LLV9_9BACI|nr:Holliday junction resolvase RuvX [Salicibibacter halophilus]QDI92850.1 Holliday junction resolvase RuvX [Salicibibacter halophilus]